MAFFIFRKHKHAKTDGYLAVRNKFIFEVSKILKGILKLKKFEFSSV